MAESSSGRTSATIPLLAFGFRPFFLVASLYAGLAMLAWLAATLGAWTLPGRLPAATWHAHEMLFGFAAAAAAGFLLTAVANWTATPPVSGGPLAGLVLLWLAGRLAFWLADGLPAAVVAAADLALIPALALAVGRPIARAGQRRNLVFAALLGLLFAANLLVHLQALEAAATAAVGLRLAIYVFALMIAVIAGRIVPSFTANALRAAGVEAAVRSPPLLDKLALAALVAAALGDLALPDSLASGALAAVAAALLGLRMRHWGTLRTLGQPILWVLHLGYAWVPAGFAVKALADLTGMLPASAALHALTTGAIGTMILAMITRVALGHTGRPLQVSAAITAAYLLVTAAALIRVAGPALAVAADAWTVAAAAAWAAAFAIYAVAYWPILTRPRSDGRPG